MNGGVFDEALPFDTTQITSRENRCRPEPGDPCHPLPAHGHAPAIAFNARQDPISGPISGPIDTDPYTSAVAFDAFNQRLLQGDVSGTMAGGDAGNRMLQALIGTAVRRLMPVECERLQGFPDGYTAITYRRKPAKDGPRYKALGNSWGVNCARWIGMRIEAVDLARRCDTASLRAAA